MKKSCEHSHLYDPLESMQNKINRPIRLKLKAAKKKIKNKKKGEVTCSFVIRCFYFKIPVDVQKQNNLCCKAGAKCNEKMATLLESGKAKAQLITKERESEQKKKRERDASGRARLGLEAENY